VIISSWLVVAFHFLSLCIFWELMTHYGKKVETLKEEKQSDITTLHSDIDCYLMTFDPQLLYTSESESERALLPSVLAHTRTFLGAKASSAHIQVQQET